MQRKNDLLLMLSKHNWYEAIELLMSKTKTAEYEFPAQTDNEPFDYRNYTIADAAIGPHPVPLVIFLAFHGQDRILEMFRARGLSLEATNTEGKHNEKLLRAAFYAGINGEFKTFEYLLNKEIFPDSLFDVPTFKSVPDTSESAHIYFMKRMMEFEKHTPKIEGYSNILKLYLQVFPSQRTMAFEIIDKMASARLKEEISKWRTALEEKKSLRGTAERKIIPPKTDIHPEADALPSNSTEMKTSTGAEYINLSRSDFTEPSPNGNREPSPLSLSPTDQKEVKITNSPRAEDETLPPKSPQTTRATAADYDVTITEDDMSETIPTKIPKTPTVKLPAASPLAPSSGEEKKNVAVKLPAASPLMTRATAAEYSLLSETDMLPPKLKDEKEKKKEKQKSDEEVHAAEETLPDQSTFMSRATAAGYVFFNSKDFKENNKKAANDSVMSDKNKVKR
jgi:hypothetical protein